VEDLHWQEILPPTRFSQPVCSHSALTRCIRHGDEAVLCAMEDLLTGGESGQIPALAIDWRSFAAVSSFHMPDI